MLEIYMQIFVLFLCRRLSPVWGTVSYSFWLIVVVSCGMRLCVRWHSFVRSFVRSHKIRVKNESEWKKCDEMCNAMSWVSAVCLCVSLWKNCVFCLLFEDTDTRNTTSTQSTRKTAYLITFLQINVYIKRLYNWMEINTLCVCFVHACLSVCLSVYNITLYMIIIHIFEQIQSAITICHFFPVLRWIERERKKNKRIQWIKWMKSKLNKTKQKPNAHTHTKEINVNLIPLNKFLSKHWQSHIGWLQRARFV